MVFEMGKLLANCSIRDPNNKFILPLNKGEIEPKLIHLSPPLCRGNHSSRQMASSLPRVWAGSTALGRFLSFVFCHPWSEQYRCLMSRWLKDLHLTEIWGGLPWEFECLFFHLCNCLVFPGLLMVCFFFLQYVYFFLLSLLQAHLKRVGGRRTLSCLTSY